MNKEPYEIYTVEREKMDTMNRQNRFVLVLLIAVIVLGLVIPGHSLRAQSFGQNKVQYENFNWSFIRTDNFEVYYYGDAKELAIFTAETSERALAQISGELNWQITERIAIIIYQSHNDFQQTNVTLSYLPEGVGGFTELFKNRVVIPFEGDYEQFRHVIHHELTHAVMNDFLYGGSIQSLVSGRVTVQLPLWMSEGYAEYSSLGWDTRSDMILRDLAVNIQIPNLQQLNGYLAYKGGQAVMRYIADTYGEPKVGEIFNEVKRKRSVQGGVRSALGGDFETVGKKWRKYIREQYWPDIEGREEIPEIATRLTDHEELNNYYNVAPAISPDGGRIAILSDRDARADIYLISAQDGEEIRKVVSGGRTPDFEELKWLQPGITWSPDGEKIALTSKTGENDALHIIDVKSGNRQSYKFRVENLFTADWAPTGDKIAMIGHHDDRSDIYVYNLKTKEFKNITRDRFTDAEPRWSPDGKRILFVSDRGSRTDTIRSPMYEFDYTKKDLYIYSTETGKIRRVTDTPYEENYAVWANTENKIAYVSDRSGIHNIYVHNLDTGENYAITNILTGVQQLSWSSDDSKLVFTGYREGGWDIYVLTNPLEIVPGSINPPLTKFRKQQMEGEKKKVYSIPGNLPSSVASIDTASEKRDEFSRRQGGSYSNYIFAPGYNWYTPGDDSLAEAHAFEDTLKSKNDSGQYISHDYKTRFTLDLVNSQAAYNTFFGFQGSTVFMFSDILGNHRFTLATDLFIDLLNSSYYLTYDYLERQTNFGVTVFNFPNYFRSLFYGLIRYRNYGGILTVSRPFNKFSRVELNTMYYNVEKKTLDIPEDHEAYQYELIQTILPSVSYVYDNTIFGYTGPHDGTRLNISYTHSPKYNDNSLQFQTAEIDYRKYWMINRQYSAALRLSGGMSEGPNAQRFFMGGVPNWLNQKFRYDLDNYIANPENIYFSEFVMPVRGARYYERAGTRYALLNAEFRFPFIQYFLMRFPLPVFFQNIRGVLFWDSGAAWSNGDLSLMKRDKWERLVFDDVVAGYGYGVRIGMGYFLLKIDVAWQATSFRIFSDSSSPKYYFSLGADF